MDFFYLSHSETGKWSKYIYFLEKKKTNLLNSISVLFQFYDTKRVSDLKIEFHFTFKKKNFNKVLSM